MKQLKTKGSFEASGKPEKQTGFDFRIFNLYGLAEKTAFNCTAIPIRGSRDTKKLSDGAGD